MVKEPPLKSCLLRARLQPGQKWFAWNAALATEGIFGDVNRLFLTLCCKYSLGQGWNDLKQISDNSVVRHLEDGRVFVLVDCNDSL